eukprot:4894535-Pleurochrysis_carterae.AAC.1
MAHIHQEMPANETILGALFRRFMRATRSQNTLRHLLIRPAAQAQRQSSQMILDPGRTACRKVKAVGIRLW